MSLPNPGMSFTPFDPLPESDLNKLDQNITGLQDWSAFDAATFPVSLLSNASITPGKRTGGFAIGTVNGNSASVAITGLDFTPKEVSNFWRPASSTSSLSGSHGTSIGTTHHSAAWNGTCRNSSTSLSFLVISSTTAAVTCGGTVTSYNSDGFTVGFSTTSNLDFTYIARG